MRTPPSLPADLHFEPERARSVIAKAIAAGRPMLTEGEAKQVLAAYGIPVAETATAANAEGVALAAAEILKTYRACVVKVLSDDISHKSDVGGVRLGLTTPRRRARLRGDCHRRGTPCANCQARGFHHRTHDRPARCAPAHHRHERGPDVRADARCSAPAEPRSR